MRRTSKTWLGTRGTRTRGNSVLATLGLARRKARRATNGRYGRMGVGGRILQVGLYSAVGVAAVAAGIWGIQRALGSGKTDLFEGEVYPAGGTT